MRVFQSPALKNELQHLYPSTVFQQSPSNSWGYVIWTINTKICIGWNFMKTSPVTKLFCGPSHANFSATGHPGRSDDHYLSIADEKSMLWCFSCLFFWATSGGKMGMVVMPIRVWALKNQNLTKKSTHWVYLLSQPLSFLKKRKEGVFSTQKEGIKESGIFLATGNF